MDKREGRRGREGGREGGGEGLSHFLIKKLMARCIKKFRRGTPLCFTNFNYWHRKKLGLRGVASVTIFRQIDLSHTTESSRRGMLLCFRKFRVSKKFLPKRGISPTTMEILLSHSTKIIP